jgi:hypothetical protein
LKASVTAVGHKGDPKKGCIGVAELENKDFGDEVIFVLCVGSGEKITIIENDHVKRKTAK